MAWGLFLVAVLPFALLFMWGKHRWRTLKQIVNPQEIAADDSSKSVLGRIQQNRWSAAVAGALSAARFGLESHPSVQAQAALGTLTEFVAIFPALSDRTQALVRTSLETGSVSSMLARQGAAGYYVVVVGGRHEHPHLLRRHTAFADGWPAHVRQIEAALPTKDRPERLLSLVFFLGTDAREGALVLAHDTADGNGILPGPLLNEAECGGKPRLDRTFLFTL